MDLADRGAISRLFPHGLPQLQGLLDKNKDDPDPELAKLRDALRRASPEYRQREKFRLQRIKGRQDRLETTDKRGRLDSGIEDFSASEANDRLNKARKVLAEAIENDTYSMGKISAAEEAYQKAIEA